MRTIRTAAMGGALVPVAVLALLATGCGTEGPGGAGTPTPPPVATASTPGVPLDFPCPGESPSPTPTPTPTATPSNTASPSGLPAGAATGTPSAPPGPGTPIPDHYGENHGFMVPFPLHGKDRCTGLAAVARIERVLEPLRRRGDFHPAHAVKALAGLGYSAADVRAYQDGPTGVGFLIDTFPICLEGGMNRATISADGFGGYPDHPACDRPTGGH